MRTLLRHTQTGSYCCKSQGVGRVNGFSLARALPVDRGEKFGDPRHCNGSWPLWTWPNYSGILQESQPSRGFPGKNGRGGEI